MRFVLLAMLLLPWGLTAADSPPHSAELWLKARALIDADGRISALDWEEEGPGGRVVIEHIEPIVRGWEFVPGMVAGEPASTQTTLSLRTRVSERPDASIDVRILEASTGAATQAAVPPRYPTAALRAGASAEVVSEIDIAADGSISIAALHFEGSLRISYKRDFLKAAEAAIRQWTFRLEEVDGHPVATRMRVPITFCTQPSRWCKQLEQERAQTAGAVEPDSAVALESVVRLQSDPRAGI